MNPANKVLAVTFVARVLLYVLGGILLKIGYDGEQSKALIDPLADAIVGGVMVGGLAAWGWWEKKRNIARAVENTKVATLADPQTARISLVSDDTRGKIYTLNGTIDPLRKITKVLALSLALFTLSGCGQTIGERLYTADRSVSLAARGVTAYVRTPGVTVSPKMKTALIQAGTAADATLNEAHAAVDAANKRGDDPTPTAGPLIDSAEDIAQSLIRILTRLKEAPRVGVPDPVGR